MKLLSLSVTAASLSYALFGAGAASADPKGLWLAQDGAHAEVGPCGAALCATIVAPNLLLIQRPAGPGPTSTIRTRRSGAARLSACLFSMVWCRMDRADGPEYFTTSTTATAIRDIS